MEPVHAVRFMALLFSAGSACALFFLARRFLEPFWAGAAAVLFAVLAAIAHRADHAIRASRIACESFAPSASTILTLVGLRL